MSELSKRFTADCERLGGALAAGELLTPAEDCLLFAEALGLSVEQLVTKIRQKDPLLTALGGDVLLARFRIPQGAPA
jgi:hypothetical protein